MTRRTDSPTTPLESRADVALYVLGDWDRAVEAWTSKRITLVSTKTGSRSTYRISRPPFRASPYPLRGQRLRGDAARRAWIVSLLIGSDNDSDYQSVARLLPRLSDDGTRVVAVALRATARCPVGITAPSWLALDYLVKTCLPQPWRPAETGVLLADEPTPRYLEVWRDSRCGRCGRTLTVDTSIRAGLGPKCARDLGL